MKAIAKEGAKQTEPKRSDLMIGRRKLLASIGTAGAALVAGSCWNGSLAARATGAASTVTGSVYGGGVCMTGKDGTFVTTIAELRTMPAPLAERMYYVADRGREGFFSFEASDISSADNSGTVIVSTSGARFRRRFDGALNVKWFGALGNGSTNDTAAIRLAIAALRDGDSLYFPPGEYIVDSGCLLFRGLMNVTLFGEGVDSWIHPSGQRTPPAAATDYHSSVAIDQCAGVEIRNLRIESKGEGWGSTNAGDSLERGDARTNFAIEKGGHALLVARSTNITIANVTGRLCGSKGVFHLSSCGDVTVLDCFANAGSSKYVLFAVNNWCDDATNRSRTYRFIDCGGWSEPGYSDRSGKGGIVVEGDETMVIHADIQGGVFKDCLAEEGAKPPGCAVGATYVNLTVDGLVSDSCLVGFYAGSRETHLANTEHAIIGCQFLRNKMTGIMLDIQAAGGGTHRLTVNGTVIQTNPEPYWEQSSDFGVQHSSGLLNRHPFNGSLHLSHVTMLGAEYGVYAMDALHLECLATMIRATRHGCLIYGGGTYEVNGSDIASELAAPFVFQTDNRTSSGASEGTGPLRVTITKSAIDCGLDQSLISLTGGITDLETVTITDNIVRNGYVNIEPGTIQTVQRDGLLASTEAKVKNSGLDGTNTFVEFNMPKDHQYGYTQIVNESGAVSAILHSVNDYSGIRGLYRAIVAGDKLASFAVGSVCRLVGL